jgi:glycosyltransferase involved in cell wall biosynthesis
MRVGIWAIAETPQGRRSIAFDPTPLLGDELGGAEVRVVALPEDAVPPGTRRVSVYRWPRVMATLCGLKTVCSTVSHAGLAVESALNGWPMALTERYLRWLRTALAAKQRPVLMALLSLALLLSLPLWAAILFSATLAGVVRGLLLPFLAAAHAMDHLRRHTLLRADAATVIAREACDVWVVPALEGDFPYPPGVRAVVVDRGLENGTGSDEVQTLRRELALLAACRLVPLLPTLAELASLETPKDHLTQRLRTPAVARPRRRVHLFLPQSYQGGVWEATRTLVNALAAVDRQRRQLELTLAVPVTQVVTGLDPEVKVERLALLVRDGESLPFSPSMPEADAWFALVDRFPAVLQAARPLGMIVHDVIQKYVPEAFPVHFHTYEWPIIRQTIARSARIITTSDITRADVIAEYGLPPERVALVPVACEPARRFGTLVPEPVAVPPGCILNPCNATPHKGASVMLRGYARLRTQRVVPPLVLCGAETDRLDPASPVPPTPYWLTIRRLVQRLGLEVGRDVFFLGFVSDAQLADLFMRCSVVVNAARYDNGTYSLIEAHYFGKPTVCSRYPAAQWLYDRFGVPVRTFAIDDEVELAARLTESLDAEPIDLTAARASLAHPRHSYGRYAEQVYNVLGELTQERVNASRRSA